MLFGFTEKLPRGLCCFLYLLSHLAKPTTSYHVRDFGHKVPLHPRQDDQGCWMTGDYDSTLLSIASLTAFSVTTTTITQAPVTTALTLPVYYCSPDCSTTISDEALTFNAEIQWPATITAQTGILHPPSWASDLPLSVSCDGQVYRVTTAKCPTPCSSQEDASASSGDIFTIDTIAYTAAPSGSVVIIDGTTLTENGPAITIGSAEVSYGSSSVLHVGTSSLSLVPTSAESSVNSVQVITLGSEALTVSPATSGAAVGSAIITQGSPAVTIDSTPVSLNSNGILVYGSASTSIEGIGSAVSQQSPGVTPAPTPPASSAGSSQGTVVVWSTTTESSDTDTATYVETQFSEYYTITSSILITTPITLTGESGQVETIDLSETIGPGGFGWFPIPLIGPGGDPLLPVPPPPIDPPNPPSCWKLGLITLGNCGGDDDGGNNEGSSQGSDGSSDSTSSPSSSSSSSSSNGIGTWTFNAIFTEPDLDPVDDAAASAGISSMLSVASVSGVSSGGTLPAAPTSYAPVSNCVFSSTTITGSIQPGPASWCQCDNWGVGIVTVTASDTAYLVCNAPPSPTVSTLGPASGGNSKNSPGGTPASSAGSTSPIDSILSSIPASFDPSTSSVSCGTFAPEATISSTLLTTTSLEATRTDSLKSSVADFCTPPEVTITVEDGSPLITLFQGATDKLKYQVQVSIDSRDECADTAPYDIVRDSSDPPKPGYWCSTYFDKIVDECTQDSLLVGGRLFEECHIWLIEVWSTGDFI